MVLPDSLKRKRIHPPGRRVRLLPDIPNKRHTEHRRHNQDMLSSPTVNLGIPSRLMAKLLMHRRQLLPLANNPVNSLDSNYRLTR